MLRQATVSDVPAIQRVRRSVRENRLVSMTIADEDVREAIDHTGRGWVIELEAGVVAFAIGNARTGNIWALFVHPDHEHHGYGRALHDTMIDWLWSQGLSRLWLTTGAGTRAQQFYEAAGWRLVDRTDSGELRYERTRTAGSSDERSHTIETARLRLVTPTLESARAQVQAMTPADKAQLSSAWLAQLASPDADVWTLGFDIIDRTTGANVGACGFKGPPDDDAVVEIAYSIAPACQGRGYATEAAGALAAFAFDSHRVHRVRAHTLPENNASTRVLMKCGFRAVGEVIDPDDGLVWRWELERDRRP